MAAFGSATPRRFGNTPSVPTFPRTAGTYTSPDGAIVVPPHALDAWYTYRNTLAKTTRGEVIAFGDSTTHGSGGLYSWLQRLRDRASGVSTGGPAGVGIADGGKGIFAGGEGISGSAMIYDAPEVNGYISSNFTGFSDQHDNLDGQYWYDNGSSAGHTLNLQFRGTCFRLWYAARFSACDFTYSVDGGAPTTVKSYLVAGGPQSRFVYVSGLSANTTHTITITNLAVSTNGGAGTDIWVALAPMNDTGLVWQKFATSGGTFLGKFYSGVATAPYTQARIGMRYQTALGLSATSVSSPDYTGAPVDTSYAAAARVKPVLAISHLGFNDLSNSTAGDEAMWTEYVKEFKGACVDAGCPGIVMSGQLPYNANWPTYGASRFQAMKAQALASGLAFVDLFYPIGGPSLSYAGGTSQPHLTRTQYEWQADYLWDNLLGL